MAVGLLCCCVQVLIVRHKAWSAGNSSVVQVQSILTCSLQNSSAYGVVSPNIFRYSKREMIAYMHRVFGKGRIGFWFCGFFFEKLSFLRF